MKKEDLARLSAYGWIDRAAGIAHIPVDRAIDIVVEKGLPKRNPKPQRLLRVRSRRKLRPRPSEPRCDPCRSASHEAFL